MPGWSRRLIVPEVIQTSTVDCGPAAFKALLGGFGIDAGYGQLRDLCHTDVDGTSVDRLEQLAGEFGLEAEQVVVPADHVLLAEAQVLPGIVVVTSPAGYPHLVVAWRSYGPLLQIMDPARGRVWMSRHACARQLYAYATTVPASAWREWAGTDEFLRPLRQRMAAVGILRPDADAQVKNALADTSAGLLARLDAGVRLIATLREGGALDRADAPGALRTLLADEGGASVIPDHCWSAQPTSGEQNGEAQLRLRGAVVLRVRRGPRVSGAGNERRPDAGPARPAILGAVRLLREDGAFTPLATVTASAIAVVGLAIEILLLQGLLGLSATAIPAGERMPIMAVVAVFALGLLGVEWGLAVAERQLGALLEARLRIALHDKIPRLGDRYFQSRPKSDLAERSHNVHQLRLLPQLGLRIVRTAMALAVTGVALAWLAPSGALLALAGAAAAAAIPLMAHSILAERDLRHRTHAGAVSRFHFDALMGRTAIDAHHAGRMLTSEHERLLEEWSRSGQALFRAAAVVEGCQLAVGLGVAFWLAQIPIGQTAAPAALLFVFWALQLPALGYELAVHLRDYPWHRSTLLRLLEPLESRDDTLGQPTTEATPVVHASTSGRGVQVELRGATVVATGRPVLDDVGVSIAAGSHVAIVGPSGAGKSTLIGLLLGWHRLAAGQVEVDGCPLTGSILAQLRPRTAWVDPTVQIWNRSLRDNLLNQAGAELQLDAVLDAAELREVIARLPEGLATRLGEGGSLLSAGEAQRVRLARALLGPTPDLVLLDEPLRGLERERRRTLVGRVRERWPHSTILYVTHDIADANAFDRVLVIERGRIVEDGAPLALAQRPASRYRRLLHAQEAILARFGRGTEWQRIQFDSGCVVAHDLEKSIEQTA